MAFKYLVIEDGRIDIFDERWYVRNNIRYASVTFVLSVDIPPELYDYGIEHGTNVHYILEDTSETGTIFHHYAETILKKRTINFDDYPPNTKEERAFKAWKRMPSFVKFYNEELSHHKIIATEETIYNDILLVGGTLDLRTEFIGKKHVWDWKTSKAVYDHHKMQVAAYAMTVGADYAHVVVFPNDNRVKQGYSITTLDKGQIEMYYEDFKDIKKKFDKMHKVPAYLKYPITITLDKEINNNLY